MDRSVKLRQRTFDNSFGYMKVSNEWKLKRKSHLIAKSKYTKLSLKINLEKND